jgi:hypothetical protein
MANRNRKTVDDLSFEQIESEMAINEKEAVQIVETAQNANDVKELSHKVEELTKMVEALVSEKLRKDQEIEALKAQSIPRFTLEQIKGILEQKQVLINIQEQFITVRDTLDNIHIPCADVDLNNEHFQLILYKYDHSRTSKDILFSINKNLVIDSAIQHMKTKIEERIFDLTIEIDNIEKLY